MENLDSSRLRFRVRPIDAFRVTDSAARTTLKTKSDVVRESLTLFSYVWEAQGNNRVVLRNDEEHQQYEVSVSTECPEVPSADDQSGGEGSEILEVRLPPDKRSLLDTLLSQGAAKSRSALVRDAIGLYHHIVARLAEGWYLAVMEPSSGRIIFPLPVPGVIQERVLPRVKVEALLSNVERDDTERDEALTHGESRPDHDRLDEILSQALGPRDQCDSRMPLSITDRDDVIWVDFSTPSPGVWIVATPTSCSWLLLYALQTGTFRRHDVPVRGLIIRKGWLSPNTLDHLLGDDRIRQGDVVLTQTLLTDVLRRFGQLSIEEEGLERLRIVAPLACHPVTISIRAECGARLDDLRGRRLAVTHEQSNYLIRLCRAIEDKNLRYRLPGRGPYDSGGINIEYVNHVDLFTLMAKGRIDAFATVEPYHYNFARDYSDILGRTFTLPAPKNLELPAYCCVAAIPEVHCQGNPTLVRKVVESLREAHGAYKGWSNSRTVSDLLSELRAIPWPFESVSDEPSKVVSFHPKAEPVVTPDELAAEIHESRRFFGHDRAFKSLSATEAYRELVLDSEAPAGNKISGRRRSS